MNIWTIDKWKKYYGEQPYRSGLRVRYEKMLILKLRELLKSAFVGYVPNMFFLNVFVYMSKQVGG